MSRGIRIQTKSTVRHTKCGRMRGMVVGEGGCSSGVLLYVYDKTINSHNSLLQWTCGLFLNCSMSLLVGMAN